MNIEIKVDNRKAILDNLEQQTEAALMECGVIVENYAKIGAPVDTGLLRNSMDHQMETKNRVAVGTPVEYGKYQELGTSRGIAPKRFLTNAMSGHISEIKAIILQHFTQ